MVRIWKIREFGPGDIRVFDGKEKSEARGVLDPGLFLRDLLLCETGLQARLLVFHILAEGAASIVEYIASIAAWWYPSTCNELQS